MLRAIAIETANGSPSGTETIKTTIATTKDLPISRNVPNKSYSVNIPLTMKNITLMKIKIAAANFANLLICDEI